MKIRTATVIAKVKHATLFAVSYIDRHGAKKQRHLVSRKKRPKCISGTIQRADATIIVPYHPQSDQLVVIREFRISLGDYQYGFPAGLLDPGEDIKIAAARELCVTRGNTLKRPRIDTISGRYNQFNILGVRSRFIGLPSSTGRNVPAFKATWHPAF